MGRRAWWPAGSLGMPRLHRKHGETQGIQERILRGAQHSITYRNYHSRRKCVINKTCADAPENSERCLTTKLMRKPNVLFSDDLMRFCFTTICIFTFVFMFFQMRAALCGSFVTGPRGAVVSTGSKHKNQMLV